MKLEELLHKRILVIQKERGYSPTQTVEELKILEISPTGNFVKIQNMNGNKYWRHSSDLVPIEVLLSLETKPIN